MEPSNEGHNRKRTIIGRPYLKQKDLLVTEYVSGVSPQTSRWFTVLKIRLLTVLNHRLDLGTTTGTTPPI